MDYEYICTGCLQNQSLIHYVKTNSDKKVRYCPICGNRNQAAISVSKLAQYISFCIGKNYSEIDDRDGIDYDEERQCYYYIDTNEEVIWTNVLKLCEENDVLSDFVDFDKKQELYLYILGKVYSKQEIYEDLAEKGWAHEQSNDLYLTWENFNYYVKYYNQFFDISSHKKGDYLDKILDILSEYEENIPKDTVLYRVRNANSLEESVVDSFDTCLREVSPPPCDKTKSFRMSPQGISYTYLSEDMTTCLKECRAKIRDKMLIAKFKTKKELRILDLKRKQMEYFDLFSGQLNRELQNMNLFIKRYCDEISKPVDADNSFDYLLTQMIAEYIRKKEYDGIAYSSAMSGEKTNYVFFYGPDYLTFPDIKPEGKGIYSDTVPSFLKILELEECSLCEIINGRSCKPKILKTVRFLEA